MMPGVPRAGSKCTGDAWVTSECWRKPQFCMVQGNTDFLIYTAGEAPGHLGLPTLTLEE